MISTKQVLAEIIAIVDKIRNSEGNIILDLNHIKSIHSFLISILSFFITLENEEIEIKNLDLVLKNKLEEIGFLKPVEFKGKVLSENVFKKYQDSKNLPICKFEVKYDQIDKMESDLKSLLFQHLNNYKLSFEYKDAIA